MVQRDQAIWRCSWLNKQWKKHWGRQRFQPLSWLEELWSDSMHLKEVPGTRFQAVQSNPELAGLLEPENVGWAVMMACHQWSARPKENRKKRGKTGRKGRGDHAVSQSLIILSGSWGGFWFLIYFSAMISYLSSHLSGTQQVLCLLLLENYYRPTEETWVWWQGKRPCRQMWRERKGLTCLQWDSLGQGVMG